MRPEECFRLRWESVTWTNGRHGTVLITHGKTAAARRVLPMTPRVRAVLEARWEKADTPDEGWIFNAPSQSGHVERSTLKKQHKGVSKR
jgi:integrase